MPTDRYRQPEFYGYTEGEEHFCPDHWMADPDNPPHEKCEVCHKKRIIMYEGRVAKEKREQEEAESLTPESQERYEILQHAPRKAGEEWDGEWVNWASGKGTGQWMSVEKVKSSLKQARSAPTNYRIVKVTYQPEVVLEAEVMEEGKDGREADSKFRQVSDADERKTLEDLAGGGVRDEFEEEMAKS